MGILAGSATFVFIDNNGVLGTLLEGSTTAPEANTIVGRLWLDAARIACAPAWARVESDANIAYGPSRRRYNEVKAMGAVWVDPVLPAWLMNVWPIVFNAVGRTCNIKGFPPQWLR